MDAALTRQAILDTAIDLFAEQGFAATSMRAIAGAVGVRESAIYHYFASKDALFDAVIASIGEARVRILEKTARSVEGRSLESVLHGFATDMAAEISTPRSRRLWRLFMRERERIGEFASFRNMFERPKQVLTAFLDDLKARGLVRKDVHAEIFAAEFFAPVAMVCITGFLGGHASKMPLRKFLRLHAASLTRAIQK